MDNQKFYYKTQDNTGFLCLKSPLSEEELLEKNCIVSSEEEYNAKLQQISIRE